MSGKRITILCGILTAWLLFMFAAWPGVAVVERDFAISGKDYVLPEDSDYDYTKSYTSNTFFYGSKSLGQLHVIGSMEKTTMVYGRDAYGATGSLSIHYTYYDKYLDTKEESWHVDSDDTKKLRGYDLGLLKSVGNGCIMIERSRDGKNWKKAVDPIKDYFQKGKSRDKSLIYTISESDYMNGMFYRIVVAYKFARRTHDGLLGFDDYERKKCVEVYEFYIASGKNHVTIRDIGNGNTLNDRSSTSTGFVICKNGAESTVIVNNNFAPEFAYFTEPGIYKINVKTYLGKVYSYNITITNGLTFTSLNPNMYESEKGKGFPLSRGKDSPVFISPLTSLSIAVPKDGSIKQANSKYGITGKSVSLYLTLKKEPENLGGWAITYDNWGKKKNQKINDDIETGEIGKGALIVQTSSTGYVWRNVEKGRYKSGLYTTDYASHYKKDEPVLIYTPSGQDVVNGIHIRVLFAYQIKKESKNEYRDCIEVYQFYLCSNELNAVTFHNLSAADKFDESFIDADHNQVEVLKHAETLEDGGYTVTGFKIDKKLNPTVKHNVRLNSNSRSTYTDTGKYDITLTSEVGSTRKVTIYVDRMTHKEALTKYFGEGFITGKRIFSDGMYPVYEAGMASYHVASVDNNVLPLYGEITNLSTGAVTIIKQNAEQKTGIITEPGEYQAIFSTSQKVITNELSGDARLFIFRFQIIPQGSAPGPVLNRKQLEDYSHLAVTDCKPVYYGLTYSSAGSGNITLAFASEKAAFDYAYNYEKGVVEVQGNGGYRYTGSFIVSQKTKFDSNWDVMDAINYFAESAVHRYYFNMSDEFTYLSLTQDTQSDYPNLRQLELPQSVTIFADGQKEYLTDIDALPLLNDKPYAYFDPQTGEVMRGFNSFEFVTDQYGGIDSKRVTITDSEGIQHNIRYSESVGQQLQAENCPSGIVTIHEQTMYGDSTEYQAVYIAPGDNQTELAIDYTHGKGNKTVVFNGSDDGKNIVADHFSIAKLYDPLDPYALVIVAHNQHEDVFTADEKIDTVWSDPGDYNITCVNRMGYGYTVPVTVVNSDKKPAVSSEIIQSTTAPVATQEPASVEIVEGESSENSGSSIAVIAIAAGLSVVAVLIIFAYRRIRLFSRVTKNMKREGKDTDA